MTNDDRTAPPTLDDDTLAMFGKPAHECTFAQLREAVGRYTAERAQLGARIDQTDAAMAEAERCGCDFLVPLDEHGQPDAARAQVLHTCDLSDAGRVRR